MYFTASVIATTNKIASNNSTIHNTPFRKGVANRLPFATAPALFYHVPPFFTSCNPHCHIERHFGNKKRPRHTLKVRCGLFVC
ncbi:hypothetical protein D3Z39_16595 [Anaerotruncus colihominis]|uniref:Uncharacterized protein n=1 Tax=Anaerotruncus colihominis TaxID=169435 RepID=A0A845RLE0_9FIRM|nr:hypothetical protein [Anaerotruncus colihominis]